MALAGVRRRAHPCWRNVKVRANKRLNNIVELGNRQLAGYSSNMRPRHHFGFAQCVLKSSQ
jgi:hypothetical protein